MVTCQTRFKFCRSSFRKSFVRLIFYLNLVLVFFPVGSSHSLLVDYYTQSIHTGPFRMHLNLQHSAHSLTHPTTD